MTSAHDDQEASGSEPRGHRWMQWLGLVVALLAIPAGVLLLWDLANPPPVAAGFTRVGGVTRVETAVEAARFWRTPPERVYMPQASAAPGLMLRAARCAMADD